MIETQIEIDLAPIGSPMVIITAGAFVEYVTLSEAITKTYTSLDPAGTLKISIELVDKSDSDPDTAVIIDAVRLNGIASPKFAWAGIYYPRYPEPWASEQADLAQVIPGQTHLGWNGRWQLDITVPVFTWCHQKMSLGWIFE
jgi:hypothetical protein